jgi:hypothetical protein
MRNTRFWLMAFVAAVLFVAFIAMLAGPQSGTAAPMPAPTPISEPASGVTPKNAKFFTAQAVTADTTSTCAEVSNYNKADIYYSVTIDGSNVNTTTLTLQHGNSDTALVDGISIQSATAVSVTNMQQAQLFGGYVCLKIDTTDASTGTVTVTANALVK